MTKEQALQTVFTLAFTQSYEVFKENEINYFKYRAAPGTYEVSLNINQSYRLFATSPAGFDNLIFTFTIDGEMHGFEIREVIYTAFLMSLERFLKAL